MRLLLAVLMMLPLLSTAQTTRVQPGDTLALFEGVVITVRDLVHRLEAVPFPGIQQGLTSRDVKQRALYAMIAEALLGNEAKRLPLRRDRRSMLMDHELENLFIRDALYKQVVSAKATPSVEEMRLGMSRLPYEFRVVTFLTDSRKAGEAVAKALRSPKHRVPGRHVPAQDTVTIRFGAPDTAFENAAFGRWIDGVSGPFSSPHVGWTVLLLLDRQSNRDVLAMSPVERRQTVEKILKDRHEETIASKYYNDLLAGRKAHAQPAMFSLVTSAISTMWSEPGIEAKRERGYVLTSDMVDVLEERLDAYLDSTLVIIQNGSISIGSVLEMLRYEDLLCSAREGEPFLIEFNNELKNLTAKEYLARKGREMGLLDTPRVQTDLHRWRDYLFAGAFRQAVGDTVVVHTDDVLQHLINNNNMFGEWYEVSVREVLSRTESESRTVLAGVAAGEPLDRLATLRSLRPEWAKNGGASGWFLIRDHPEIGYRALLADSGTVVGPVAVDNGYSVFERIGVRRTAQAPIPIDSLRTNIETRLLADRRRDAVNRILVTLARNNHLRVNNETLDGVGITNIQAFTRRYIGFGGRMTAFPLLMHLWDWYGEYQAGKVFP